MTALTFGLLKTLSETPAAPGNEGSVRDFIARTLHPFVDSMHIDGMGNLVAFRRGSQAGRPQIMVAAHMDEVALIVKSIESNGLLAVADSRGLNLRTVLGKAVQVGPDRLPGVVGIRPVHLAVSTAEFAKAPSLQDIAVDIGAANKAAAAARVKVGDPITFATAFGFLGPERQQPAADDPLPPAGRIKGKAFDNRMGCAVLMSLLMAGPPPFDLTGVFTVQEELGLRGALVAGQTMTPDVLLVLEGTVCDDLPGPPHEPRFPTTRLGDGPALTQRDRSFVVHPPLLQHLLRTAQAHGIPVQFKHPNIGGTDAAGFNRWRHRPTAIISVPCRYIHGPVAVAELSDLHNAFALLQAALPGIPTVSGVQPS